MRGYGRFSGAYTFELEATSSDFLTDSGGAPIERAYKSQYDDY